MNLLANVDLVLSSPSRATLTFNKALTDLGSGFFNLSLTAEDSVQLIDDTYEYDLQQDGISLKVGVIRRIELEFEEDGQLDAVLDFLLA